MSVLINCPCGHVEVVHLPPNDEDGHYCFECDCGEATFFDVKNGETDFVVNPWVN
jgi:lysyl-tRNA synthetase class I